MMSPYVVQLPEALVQAAQAAAHAAQMSLEDFCLAAIVEKIAATPLPSISARAPPGPMRRPSWLCSPASSRRLSQGSKATSCSRAWAPAAAIVLMQEREYSDDMTISQCYAKDSTVMSWAVAS